MRSVTFAVGFFSVTGALLPVDPGWLEVMPAVAISALKAAGLIAGMYLALGIGRP